MTIGGDLMKKQEKKKKNIKQGIILSLLIFIIIIFAVIYFRSPSFQLWKKGYQSSEISLIEKNLTDEQISDLIKSKQKTSIKDLEKQKEFQVQKLSSYITFDQSYPNQKANKIVKTVNLNLHKQKGFNIKKLDRYFGFYEVYPSLDIKHIVALVNQDIDQLEINDTDFLPSVISEKYYIENRLPRYISYHDTFPSLGVSTVVRHVNANSDYDYYTNTTPSDINDQLLILANKYTYLDANYKPDDLVTVEGEFMVRKEVRDAYQKMSQQAAQEGLSFHMNSAYRSYQSQQQVYQEYKQESGQAYADKYASRPGYSEHQTGLAIDITTRRVRFNSFDETEEYKWLQAHAHEYGFILRFPKGLEKITGYNYEPWHYRYVGVEAATKIKQENITFEEYYAFYVNQ